MGKWMVGLALLSSHCVATPPEQGTRQNPIPTHRTTEPQPSPSGSEPLEFEFAEACFPRLEGPANECLAGWSFDDRSWREQPRPQKEPAAFLQSLMDLYSKGPSSQSDEIALLEMLVREFERRGYTHMRACYLAQRTRDRAKYERCQQVWRDSFGRANAYAHRLVLARKEEPRTKPQTQVRETYYIGMRWYYLGEHERAATTFAGVVEQIQRSEDPLLSKARIGKAVATWARGEQSAAEALFAKVPEPSQSYSAFFFGAPAYSTALCFRAVAAEQRGEVRTARAHFQAISNLASQHRETSSSLVPLARYAEEQVLRLTRTDPAPSPGP